MQPPEQRKIRLYNIDGHEDYQLPVEISNGAIMVDRSNLPSHVEELFGKQPNLDLELFKVISYGEIDNSPSIDVSQLR